MHFGHFAEYQQSIWKCLCVIAERLGGVLFTPFLSHLVPAILTVRKCGNRLASCAATDALTKVALSSCLHCMVVRLTRCCLRKRRLIL